MSRALGERFFNRPTLAAAEALLGCFLCRSINGKVLRLQITEVEAYDGPSDRASHAMLHRAGEHKAGKTARNAPMFGPAGRWYVYFTYGMHWMLNIVTGRKGYPAAVLIRGTAQISGPARLTNFLKVDGAFNAKRATRRAGLWIETGAPVSGQKIQRTARVGVPYAGAWAKKRYRFLLR